MKIQRSTLILLLSALLLGGFVYVYEIQGTPKREAARTKQQQIFAIQADNVESVTVKTKVQTLIFQRNNQTAQPKIEESKWLMKVVALPQATQPAAATCTAPPAGDSSAETSTPANCATTSPTATESPSATASPTAAKAQETKPPEAAKPSEVATSGPIPAQDNYVDYLLNLLTTRKSDRSILMSDPAKQRREFGLEEPMATVEVKLKNQETRRLILGKPDFNNSSYYAQVESPANKTENLEVLLVSTDFDSAVNRSLSEWKKEETQETEKPSGEKPSSATPKQSPGSSITEPSPATPEESPNNSPQSEGNSSESQGTSQESGETSNDSQSSTIQSAPEDSQ